VETDAGTFEGDVLVVTLGADLHPEATPGLVEGGHEFYTNAGAFALAPVIDAFPGGRAVVAVTSTPFKCPPAPSETALLLHDHLVARGLREASTIDVVMPMPVPIPPSPAASEAVLSAFAERGITWHGGALVRELDPAAKVARLATGEELPYDLFLGVPTHRPPEVVVRSGLTGDDGWINVDPRTLETRFPGVYAAGDVTSVGTPKAGVFAEGQAGVIADRIIAAVRGEEQPSYDGRGTCYLEFGHDQVAMVDVTFLPGQPPVGEFLAPSAEHVADKRQFGSSRIERWFGAST
jgi:sulfide:quinone oxidoreductase